MDSNQCVDKSNANCEDWVTLPNYCPPVEQCAKFTNCGSCTSQSNACGWCIDQNSCVTRANEKNCGAVINNQQFCPSWIIKNF